MRRRGLTVLIGAVIVAVLAGGVLAAPVPYVVLDAGPTVDTLGERDGTEVIEIAGTGASSSAGELRLTTVGVDPETNLLGAIVSWFDGEEAVVPREQIYPPGQSPEEVQQRNRQQFTRSQDSAEVAALRHLGYPAQVLVAEVLPGSPTDGVLQAGDVITSVDGTSVEAVTELQQLITADPPGTSVTIEYVRDGDSDTVEITTRAAPDDPDTPRIGVAIDYQIDVPFEITIDLERIGGPSAGLMFALGIIDKLEPEDLTGGHVVAGTGSINGDGQVGPIGGIPQKLVAADQVGASTFLVPARNCQEAVANAPDGMVLVRVEDLDDALAGLAALRSDREPPTTC